MIEQAKINAVNDYLRAEFPKCQIKDRYDFDRMSHTFHISCANLIHLLTISREFLDDHTTSQISNYIRESALSNALRTAGGSRVVLSNQGISKEGGERKLSPIGDLMIQHLVTKWRKRPCPMCGEQQWGIMNSLYELKTYHKDVFMTEGLVVPIIPVVCGNCGNTVLVNAVTVGIVKTDRKDQQ